jgi:hypothetical protein
MLLFQEVFLNLPVIPSLGASQKAGYLIGYFGKFVSHSYLPNIKESIKGAAITTAATITITMAGITTEKNSSEKSLRGFIGGLQIGKSFVYIA